MRSGGLKLWNDLRSSRQANAKQVVLQKGGIDKRRDAPYDDGSISIRGTTTNRAKTL